ncbi:hypothetical protein CBL_08760 [Carabus blaptoides fortunei]
MSGSVQGFLTPVPPLQQVQISIRRLHTFCSIILCSSRFKIQLHPHCKTKGSHLGNRRLPFYLGTETLVKPVEWVAIQHNAYIYKSGVETLMLQNVGIRDATTNYDQYGGFSDISGSGRRSTKS